MTGGLCCSLTGRGFSCNTITSLIVGLLSWSKKALGLHVLSVHGWVSFQVLRLHPTIQIRD